MNAAARSLAFWFLLMSLGCLFATGLYQRMASPSLIQTLDMQPQGRGNDPQPGGNAAAQRPPAPLPEADAAELGGLMAKLKAAPDNTDTLLAIADVFRRNKDWEKALGFLRRAADSAPADMRPQYFQGMALAEKGDSAPAAEAFEKALLLAPNNASARFSLAVLYRHYLNNPGRARELLEAIVASPDAEEAVKARARTELTGL